MFTLEIAGRPVAVTDATDQIAREIFADDEFKADLKSLESEGKPLWDGRAALNVRPASEEEVAEFEAAAEEADEDDEDDDGDEEGPVVVFLVPVGDPEDES